MPEGEPLAHLFESEGMTEEKAQSIFDVLQQMVRDCKTAIDNKVTVGVSGSKGLSDEHIAALRDGLDHHCILQWGVPLQWTQTKSSPDPLWVGTVPPDVYLPAMPMTCATCGAIFDAMNSRYRFLPGGWEHQCYDAQSGYFPASD